MHQLSGWKLLKELLISPLISVTYMVRDSPLRAEHLNLDEIQYSLTFTGIGSCLTSSD